MRTTVDAPVVPSGHDIVEPAVVEAPVDIAALVAE